MKRSTQVSLVVMTAAGIGAGAYALAPNDNCRQSTASTTAREREGPVQPASAPDCRSSHGGSAGHDSSLFFYAGSGSSGSGSAGATTPAANRTPAATSPSRGGFGSIGHALASFAGS
jgi:hypothetical protein